MADLVWDADWEKTLDVPVRQALGRAGRIVKAGAQRRAPVSPDGSYDRAPGYLRDHIVDHPVTEDERGLYVDVESAARTPDGVAYGLFPEVGTRPHVIESHGDYPLRNRKTGQVFGRRVHHPGTPEQPYLRPALGDIDGHTL